MDVLSSSRLAAASIKLRQAVAACYAFSGRRPEEDLVRMVSEAMAEYREASQAASKIDIGDDS